MSQDIQAGDRVWIDRDGPTLESMTVDSIDGETVTLTDTRDLGCITTVTAERHISDVYPDREAAIRAGAAHPEDWHVTATRDKYWQAYRESGDGS